MLHNVTHDTTITYQGMIHNAILMIQQLHTKECFIMLYS